MNGVELPVAGHIVDRVEADKTVATDVYWLMTGPRVFSDRVAAGVLEHRSLAIFIPARSIPGFITALEKALQRAHLDNEQTRWVKIADEHDVATLVGTLFDTPALHPIQLAHRHGSIRTVVLQPTSESAAAACQQYLQAFEESVTHVPRSRGQPTLVVMLPQSLDAPTTPVVRRPQDIVFSGALTHQEMEAYVAVRMGDRSGPGDTELLRMLVSEFAGFDAQLAEQLIRFSDEAILGLPNSLGALYASGDARWRTGRWSAGCYTEEGGKRRRHVLYEYFLSQHAGPEQSDANAWLKRRYWRACLRSLLPWLEERRSQVIGVLRGALEQHLKKTGGKAVRSTDSGYRIETAIDDLEYNQIPALVRHEGLTVGGARQKLAVDVCFAAKRVRDSMAHMRPPEARQIFELNDLMARLLGQ